MKPIKIVAAGPESSQEVCDLLTRSISESCAKDHRNNPEILRDWLANKTPENIRTWIENNRTLCAISEQGKVVGVLQASSENRILLNYVDPDHLNSGIGTLMLEALEKAIGRGNQLFVETTETARPFYYKKGFRKIGEEPNELSKHISL